MMKVVWGALLLSSALAWGTTYYVSSSGGNDSNSGTSSSAAWQTVAKVNGQTFLPGDSILFKRGDLWNESLAPPSSGAAGNPITFDAYGSGPAPNLTGYYAVPSTAWALVSGNAWKAALPATYSTVNFCLFGSVWGQKVAASTANLQGPWDFYFANGFLYVYSAGNPASSYNTAIVPMALSNVPVINVNGKSWLTFQHFLVNWFDQYGVYVQGASDHLVFANMESDSMITQGTQPLGFYVNESAPGPGDLKIYNAEAHLNYEGFRFDGAASAITLINDKAYANRDGALVDNTGAVTYSYCHFYASSLAVATSTDVEWTSGTGPTAGAGNITADTAPAVQAWQRYPAEVTLTVDDAGMTAGADTYYANTVLPVADAAGAPVGAAVTVGYPLAQTLVSEFQGWVNAGRDVVSHSMSHTYYTNTDALEIQYTGSGSAATLSITNKTLIITVTGASDGVTYNLAQGQPQGTILGLEQALTATGHFTATENPTCQGPYGTGCSAYTKAALLAQDLADVSSQDVKTSVYHMLLDVTRLTTDEITLSQHWMTSNLTGLPATAVYVYPGGYETATMQGIAAGVPYGGARGALKEDLGVKDTYASGFDVQNITSFGVNPTWQGLTASALNQKVQAMAWKQMVWGVPWGIFWHKDELSQTEVANLFASLQASGATIQSNTGLVNWLRAGTLKSGAAGNYYYKLPATSVSSSGGGLDFRPTASSPVVDAGQNLGAAYAIDINGVNQNSYGRGWEIGAHVYVGYSSYGAGGASHFAIGAPVAPATCGPPSYDCASTSTANPGTITAIFSSTAPTPTTCSGMCQNATAEDTTISGHIAGTEVITRITDGTSNGASVGLTVSGGDNDHMFSMPNGTYLWYGLTGGTVQLAHLSRAGGRLQVVNTGAPLNVNPHSGFSTSWVSETRFYFFSTQSQLVEGDLTSDTTYTQTNVVDFMGTGVCPGITPFTVGWKGILNVSENDDTFTIAIGPSGGQGHGDLVFSYSRTQGCSVANFNTGQVWGFCKAPSTCDSTATPLGTFATNSTTCWGSAGSTGHGIHSVQATGDGTSAMVNVADGGYWTQGGCNGNPLGEIQFAEWTIGTLTNLYVHGSTSTDSTFAFSNHPSEGITHSLSNDFYFGPNLRLDSNPAVYTQFANRPATGDLHCSWPHNDNGTYDDNLPYLCATDLVSTSGGTVGVNGCTSAVYCPNYFANSIVIEFPYATYPPGMLKVVAHTYECGDGNSAHASCSDGLADYFAAMDAIGVVSPTGDAFCWASTMLHNLGNDNGGNPRGDGFCVYLGAWSAAGGPASPFWGFSESNTNGSNWPTVTYKMQRYWDSPPNQWPSINTASGVFTWTNLDANLALAYNKGADVMYTLARTPPWATSQPTDTTCNYQSPAVGGGNGECYPPSDLNADGSGTNAIWKAWITAIATHVNDPTYRQSHAHIKYWEIWNEPDTAAFWHGSIAQLARLTEDANCIITGRGVIHQSGNGTATPCTASAIDSTAQIVMSSAHAKGVALTYGQNELYCNNTSGIPSYELPCPNPANAIAAAVDVINFHMKPGNESGNNCPAPTPCTPESATQMYIANIQGMLQAPELAKALWNGEAQFSTTGFTGSYTDSDMAASFMPRFYLLNWSLGVSGMAWYSASGQPASATSAYQQTDNWLSNATLTSACAASGTVWSCGFTRSGKAYLVMWDTAQSCSAGSCTTANQTVASEWTEYRDMTTASAALPIVSHSVPVGIKPVVLQ